MADKQIALTDDEKFELQLLAEQELCRLARNYTILERNRAEFTSDGGKLGKKRRVLNIFKRERHNILTDLKVASAKGKAKDDNKLTNKISELLDEHDYFDGKIITEKSHLKELDDQVQMVKKRILELATQQISDEKYTQRVIKGEKTLQTLENKLEVQIKKFCAICADNICLREELNHLLIERREFNKIWDRLIHNLFIGKKFMLDLIEQATIAYDQREEWVSKLQFLRSKAKNDLIAHIQEMRTLQRKRDNDAKLQEFFAVKGQKRLMQDIEARELEKRRKKKEKLQEQLTEYIRLMRDIKEFTGTNQVQEIAKNFLDQEEENFAVFKYINELNREMENLSDTLGHLHIDIDCQKALNDVRFEQQANTVDNLKVDLDNISKLADEKETVLHKVESDLNTVVNGVENLFHLFRCKNDPLIMLLGHNETVNYHNILLYLEILEKNIQESFVTVYSKEEALLKSKKIKPENMTIVVDKSAKRSVEPIERICRTNPCPLCIEHELVSDVIDLLQFAYTKDEIQVKLKQRLEIEGPEAALHTVSACHLPKSRQIIQKRYQ